MGYLRRRLPTIVSVQVSGLFEAWANLYDRFAIAMEARNENDGERLQEPSGFRGLRRGRGRSLG